MLRGLTATRYMSMSILVEGGVKVRDTSAAPKRPVSPGKDARILTGPCGKLDEVEDTTGHRVLLEFLFGHFWPKSQSRQRVG